MGTNPEPNRSVFEQALDAAERERDGVRAEIATLRERLDTLAARDANLSQTVKGLCAILGRQSEGHGAEKPEAAVPSGPLIAADAHGARAADASPQQVHDGASHESFPPLPQPSMLSRRVAPDSSPYRVGVILSQAQGAMPREAIIHEYLRRGWSDPKWQGDPANNISQAIRRAVKYGWAYELPGLRNVFRTTLTPEGDQVPGFDAHGGASS